MKTSKIFSLNWHDLGKGFLVAFLAFGINFLQETFVPSLNISPEIKLLIITFLGYLTKNFFSSNSTQSTSREALESAIIGTRPNDR